MLKRKALNAAKELVKKMGGPTQSTLFFKSSRKTGGSKSSSSQIMEQFTQK